MKKGSNKAKEGGRKSEGERERKERKTEERQMKGWMGRHACTMNKPKHCLNKGSIEGTKYSTINLQSLISLPLKQTAPGWLFLLECKL